jgi:hypothetical protein
VNKGTVRVVQEADRKWNWEGQKYDVDEKATVEGEQTKTGNLSLNLI